MSLPESRRLDFSEIAILDILPLVEGNHDASLINNIYKACADVGFFYVRNHGVPQILVESVRDSAQAFFSAPMTEKMEVLLDPRIRGYSPANRSYSAGHLIEGEDRAGTSLVTPAD